MSTRLDHSPADIVRQMLIDLSVSGDSSAAQWPTFTASEPSDPDDCVTVYDTEPMRDGRAMTDGEQWVHYGIQIRIRASDHRTGWAKAHQIKLSIDEDVNLRTMRIEGRYYLVYNVAETSLRSLGRDITNTKRVLFVINGLVTIRPVN